MKQIFNFFKNLFTSETRKDSRRIEDLRFEYKFRYNCFKQLLNANNRMGTEKAICVPEGKPARHFRDVYIKYATKKTTDLEKPAVMVALGALKSAYPCDK